MSTKTAAEERLLDLALGEVLCEVPGRAVRAGSPRRPWPLLHAALFALAVGIVGAVAWQQRAGVAPAQDRPASLPACVHAESAAELAALPVTAANIEARFANPRELAGLRRFRDLRRLRVMPSVASPALGAGEPATRIFEDAMAAATESFRDGTAFTTIGDLRTLEELELPDGVAWTPEHLGFLRNLKLTSFAIWVIDLRAKPMIDALVAAPTFRTLRLGHSLVSADLFRALEPLRLERLELRECAGLDDDAWAALARLRSLHELDVRYASNGTATVGNATLAVEALGDSAFDAFAKLPELRHLGLHESDFPGDLLTRLPATLTSLDLGNRRNTLGDLRSLRRLTALRALTFGGERDEDAATVLPSWSLERLDYRSPVHGKALLDAIAAQPDLIELALRPNPRLDLSPLVAAKRLRTLALFVTFWDASAPGIPMAQLRPLRACEGLRELRLFAPKLDKPAIHELFGDRVAIEFLTPP